MSLTTLSDNITTNGLYEYDPPAGYDGFSSATINVNVTTTPNLTPGSATITSNGTTEIDPPAGYDGFSSFTITTNVSLSDIDYDFIRVYTIYDNTWTTIYQFTPQDQWATSDGFSINIPALSFMLYFYPIGSGPYNTTDLFLVVNNGTSSVTRSMVSGRRYVIYTYGTQFVTYNTSIGLVAGTGSDALAFSNRYTVDSPSEEPTNLVQFRVDAENLDLFAQ
ncbi:MAG: hypothetical protein IJH64_15460 [Oscillospiraceae bacterium]|nr:hypothetical protein [Oscillospiraceae bacterium]